MASESELPQHIDIDGLQFALDLLHLARLHWERQAAQRASCGPDARDAEADAAAFPHRLARAAGGTVSGQRPDAGVVGESVSLPIVDVVEDADRLFTFGGSESATHLLKIEAKGSSRPQEEHGFNGWDVKSLTEKIDIAEHAHVTAMESTDRICSRSSCCFTIDVLGADACGSKGFSDALARFNRPCKHESATVPTMPPIVADSVTNHC